MNYVISIVDVDALPELTDVCRELDLPIAMTFSGRGTAVQSMLDILGIEARKKRVLMTVANEEKTEKMMKEQKRRLYMGVPGHGISVAVPVKSIGGGETVAFLNGDSASAKYTPDLDFKYELIVVIANEGRNDDVMNAARAAGAGGGTVIHGRGTGTNTDRTFYNVSLASEKEVILIVAKKNQKANIMRSILEKAGPQSKAGAVLFSLPITKAAGFGMFDEDA